MTGFYRYLLNEQTGENVKAGDNVKTEVDKPSEIVIAEEDTSKGKVSNKDNTDSQQDEAISMYVLNVKRSS